VFLDSSMVDRRTGRYSYLSADPFLVLQSRGQHITLWTPTERLVCEGDPFVILRDLLRRYAVAPLPGLPPFVGGAIGYFGYDVGRLLERLPARAADHLVGHCWLIATGLATGEQGEAEAQLAALQARLAGPVPSLPPTGAQRGRYGTGAAGRER